MAGTVQVAVAGAINWDINLFVSRFPRSGEEAPVARITRVPGGKAGNVAVAAARLLGPKKVGILGTLGRDEIADTQMQLLKNEGVVTSAICRIADSESGQAYIITEESGENVVYTYFGANALFRSGNVLGTPSEEMIRDARIVTITDPPQETVEAITKIAHEAGRLIAWDPGVRARAGMDDLRSILLRVSYLFLNEVEVEYMTGVRDPAEAVKRLSAINSRLAAIMKYGREGCTMFKRQAETRIPGIDLPKHGLKVINTVGCGDAFLGAFSAAKALGAADEEALNWANWAGALKATKSETRGSPTATELAKWTALNRGDENH